jgi:hypothetical protein
MSETRLTKIHRAVLTGLAEGARLEVCIHDSMDGRHLGDEIRERETMLWFPHRPYGARRVNVRANTIHSLMRAGLIREQDPGTITGPVRTMHLTEQGRAALTPR